MIYQDKKYLDFRFKLQCAFNYTFNEPGIYFVKTYVIKHLPYLDRSYKKGEVERWMLSDSHQQHLIYVLRRHKGLFAGFIAIKNHLFS